MFLRHIKRQLSHEINLCRKLKLNAFRGNFIIRTKYCNRNVLNLHERGMFEAIFPDNAT